METETESAQQLEECSCMIHVWGIAPQYCPFVQESAPQLMKMVECSTDLSSSSEEASASYHSPVLTSAPPRVKREQATAPPYHPLLIPTAAPDYFPRQRRAEDEVTIACVPDCCKVPSTIRHLKKELYTPKVVSIGPFDHGNESSNGPFHHGNKRLQDMERHKKVLFKRFTQRANLSWDDLVPFVKDLEPKVRASYPETNHCAYKPRLVDLILLDAGFIIELFIMVYKNEMNADAKLNQPWLRNSILLDLLLLENQLPFFFIEELFNEAFPDDCCCHGLPSFLELTYEYFDHFNKQQLKPTPGGVKIKHFTDLLRLFYLQGKKTPKRDPIQNDGSHRLVYNANALKEAGIKLKDNRMSKYFLDLKFSGHVLEIPQIVVDDNTELLFRNMIALEQCHYPEDAYITDYALVLDWLIDTNKDAELLVHKKIVRSYLGDAKHVAVVFNGLSNNVVQSTTFNSNFVGICKRLNCYCENPCNQRWATLRHDYCRTPWQTAASIGGSALLFLAVVQTIFTILQVVK